MENNKELLLKAAARLYSIGIEVEAARERLKKLVLFGVSYDSVEMVEALNDFQTLDSQWKQLEADYLELKKEIQNDT